MKLGRAALLFTFAATAHGFVPTSPPLRRAAAVPLSLKPVPSGSFGASTLGRHRVASRQSELVNEPEVDDTYESGIKNAIDVGMVEAARQRTECVLPPPRSRSPPANTEPPPRRCQPPPLTPFVPRPAPVANTHGYRSRRRRRRCHGGRYRGCCCCRRRRR